MKRVVRLKNRQTGEILSYPTIAELVRQNGKETLGIGLNALYNAVNANNGEWANDAYKVYYENIELGKKEWS